MPKSDHAEAKVIYDADYPTCPHCGTEHEDYCDFNDGKVYECYKCGKEFKVTIDTSPTFTTEAV